MVDRRIINYLRENKNKFPQEVLKRKLIEASYPKDQIEEGIRIVYEGFVPKEKISFWDFKSIKIYKTFREKLLDFLAGFFTPAIFGLGIYFLLGILSAFIYPFYPFRYFFSLFRIFLLAILGIQIFGIFYFWRKRKYLARGFLFSLILPLILIGLFFLILLIFRRF